MVIPSNVEDPNNYLFLDHSNSLSSIVLLFNNCRLVRSSLRCIISFMYVSMCDGVFCFQLGSNLDE